MKQPRENNNHTKRKRAVNFHSINFYTRFFLKICPQIFVDKHFLDPKKYWRMPEIAYTSMSYNLYIGKAEKHEVSLNRKQDFKPFCLSNFYLYAISLKKKKTR